LAKVVFERYSIQIAHAWLLRRRPRREVSTRLWEGRLVTRAGLFVIAIRAGVISVEEADEIKEILQQYRFRMAFRSFRELLDSPKTG
jgi:hypothetical protein